MSEFDTNLALVLAHANAVTAEKAKKKAEELELGSRVKDAYEYIGRILDRYPQVSGQGPDHMVNPYPHRITPPQTFVSRGESVTLILNELVQKLNIRNTTLAEYQSPYRRYAVLIQRVKGDKPEDINTAETLFDIAPHVARMCGEQIKAEEGGMVYIIQASILARQIEDSLPKTEATR